MHIHPEYFVKHVERKPRGLSDGKQVLVESSLHDYQWTEHADSGCAVCSLFRNQNKGGGGDVANRERNVAVPATKVASRLQMAMSSSDFCVPLRLNQALLVCTL